MKINSNGVGGGGGRERWGCGRASPVFLVNNNTARKSTAPPQPTLPSSFHAALSTSSKGCLSRNPDYYSSTDNGALNLAPFSFMGISPSPSLALRSAPLCLFPPQPALFARIYGSGVSGCYRSAQARGRPVQCPCLPSKHLSCCTRLHFSSPSSASQIKTTFRACPTYGQNGQFEPLFIIFGCAIF